MKRLTVFLLLVAATCLKAQTPFKLGVIEEIQSKVLNEKRVMNIYLPDEYNDSTQKKYPVIYLLDAAANEDFVHTVGIVQFLNMIGYMQPTIVVGIVNVDRERDFTYPASPNFDPPAEIKKFKKEFPHAGGSANFIAFIENELQPFVENKFRVTGSKILIGQSLGGLLASQILLEKTNLFTRYIIVSPSLWWDNESLLKKNASTYKNTNASIHILVGKEGKMMVGDAKKLYKIVAKNNPTAKFSFLPKETHLTILHNALYKAFYPDKN